MRADALYRDNIPVVNNAAVIKLTLGEQKSMFVQSAVSWQVVSIININLRLIYYFILRKFTLIVFLPQEYNQFRILYHI